MHCGVIFVIAQPVTRTAGMLGLWIFVHVQHFVLVSHVNGTLRNDSALRNDFAHGKTAAYIAIP
jgi:hypothetical protein